MVIGSIGDCSRESGSSFSRPYDRVNWMTGARTSQKYDEIIKIEEIIIELNRNEWIELPKTSANCSQGTREMLSCLIKRRRCRLFINWLKNSKWLRMDEWTRSGWDEWANHPHFSLSLDHFYLFLIWNSIDWEERSGNECEKDSFRGRTRIKFSRWRWRWWFVR